jgi:hypothetical protein
MSSVAAKSKPLAMRQMLNRVSGPGVQCRAGSLAICCVYGTARVGTSPADSVEAFGWIIDEFGDMTAYYLVLAAECRRDPSCDGLSKVA